MELKFTSECLTCGTHHDGGGMIGLTSDRNSGNEVEHSHCKVLYDTCCRYDALRNADIRSNANGNVLDECWDALQAFIKIEEEAFVKIKTITRTSNGTPTHEVITTYGHDWMK
jgi:hypothetical protein